MLKYFKFVLQYRVIFVILLAHQKITFCSREEKRSTWDQSKLGLLLQNRGVNLFGLRGCIVDECFLALITFLDFLRCFFLINAHFALSRANSLLAPRHLILEYHSLLIIIKSSFHFSVNFPCPFYFLFYK